MTTTAWRLVFVVALLALAAAPAAQARTTPVCLCNFSTPTHPDPISAKHRIPPQAQILKVNGEGRHLLSSEDRAAIAVAEILEDEAGKLGAKALLTGSPASPGLLSPSPPSCTRTPIEAYCLPFRNNKGTGCLAKVAKADPGSEVWFRLQTARGEWIRSYVKLEKNATYGHTFFYLEDSQEYQAHLLGTVVYKEEFDCVWPVLTADPSAETYPIDRRSAGRKMRIYRSKVPVGNGQFVTIDMFHNIWTV